MKSAKKFYWIRLKADFFDLETIDWLVSQKNGCEYVVLYQKLCLLTANKNGELSTRIGDMIVPYDANKISRDTKFSVDTVIVALELFKKLGLIYEQDDGILKIPYVEEVVGSETEYAKKKREYRANKEIEASGKLRLKRGEEDNVSDNVSDNVLKKSETISDKSKRLEIRDNSIDIDKEKEKEKESVDYSAIVNAYRETCVSLPSLRNLSEARKKAIKARLRSGYTIDDFITLFEKAQESDFLKGNNNRNWVANFDWLIKDSNMAKVLDGNYDNRKAIKNSNAEKREYNIPGIIEL